MTADIAGGIGLVHQGMDGSRVAKAAGDLMRACHQQATQSRVRAVRQNCSRLDDYRLYVPSWPGLEHVRDGKEEADRMAAPLREKYQFRPHIGEKGTVLGHEPGFIGGRVQEVVAKAHRGDSVDPAQLFFQVVSVQGTDTNP